MIRILLASTILAALTLPALAGTVSVTITSGNTTAHPSGYTDTETITIPDAGIEQFYSWLTRHANNGDFNGTANNAPSQTCNTATPPICTPSAYTVAQALHFRMNSMVQSDISAILSDLKAAQAAAAAAANPIPTITAQ